MRAKRIILLAAIAGLAVACSNEPPPVDEADASDAASSEWKQVAVSEMTTSQLELQQRGVQAWQKLASRLMGELSDAMESSGPDGAIEVCSLRAPEIAAEVSNEYAVLIGRTSFQLRNPANKAPDWAEALIAARVAEPTWLVRSDGRIAGLLPITAQPVCTTCHGPAEAIDPAVAEKIAVHYPDDQATGFRDGDLRGWFWVETRPTS